MALRIEASGVLLVSLAVDTVLYFVASPEQHPSLARVFALANDVDASARWNTEPSGPVLVVDITGPIQAQLHVDFGDPDYVAALDAQRALGARCLPILCASKHEVEQSVRALNVRDDPCAFMHVGIGCDPLEFPPPSKA